jgi:hypothetical protein
VLAVFGEHLRMTETRARGPSFEARKGADLRMTPSM